MKHLYTYKFWPVLILISSIQLVYGALYGVILHIFYETQETNATYIVHLYLYSFIFLYLALWLLRRQHINIKSLYKFPNVKELIPMVIIILIARFIVTLPFPEPIGFIKSIIHNQARVIGLSTRPIFPLLDLKTILLCPIIEELFFRGVILRNFIKRYPPLIAIILSSLIFGIYHPNLENLIYYIIAGIIFGVLYYSHNSLTTCTLSHIIWNAVSLFKINYLELNNSNLLSLPIIYILALYVLVFLLKKNYKVAQTPYTK